MRRDAGACACASRGRIRRSDVRIGAVVDIEKGSLRAFKQYLFAALHRAMEVNHGIRHMGPQFFAGGEISFVYIAKADRLRA